jgi:GT2 family glycosyltransferase
MSVESEAASIAPSRPAAPRRAKAGDAWTIAVIIPTLGRPKTVRRIVDRLAAQTRRSDRILVVGASEADVSDFDAGRGDLEVCLAPKGSCSQRNHAIGRVGREVDLLAFFDDDFMPADDFLARAEAFLKDQPDVVGICGRVLADGANGPGISFETATAMLAGPLPGEDEPIIPLSGLYGCNMVFRASAVGDIRFDENLPLYGWQEDFDFSRRVGERGRLVAWPALSGVHMGEKSGKGSGKRFGYSQVANPLYLVAKGSMPKERAWRLMRDNVISNLGRSLWPEPYVDRRGRLLGNLIALRDLAAHRMHPRRILEFD